ncbi:MAG TPA: hypothetical protein VEB42_01690, partial [Chitinophagaceae bacterium]|nr:hypothetical protein [Chitinophagaceae bacterium]
MKKAPVSIFLLGLLLLLGIRNAAFASTDPPVISVLSGALNQLQTDSLVVVEDSKFTDPAYSSRTEKNRISFRMDEASAYFLKTAFSATIQLRITYTWTNSTTSTEDKSFTINYDPAQFYTNNSTYVFENAYRVQVKVLSRSTNVSWDVWKALAVDNVLQSSFIANFSCTDDAIQTINHTALGAGTTADELPVSWGNVTGADEYDLEWTYIDKSALDSNRYGNPVDPELVFNNNASRVTITGTSYNIPLIYDGQGSLFFRVRPVQLQPGGGRTEAHWSTDHLPGGFGRFDYNGHETALN